MIIRKQYKFEGAHIVRHCYSTRCSASVHGHSYIVEVKLQARALDEAGMVLDFGVMKDTIGNFIDSFDHAICIWEKDKELLDFAKLSDRHIVMPISPSAENLAIILMQKISKILDEMRKQLCNSEDHELRVHSVIVHETATGYAECQQSDIKIIRDRSEELVFSAGIKRDWAHNWEELGAIDFDFKKPRQQCL